MTSGIVDFGVGAPESVAPDLRGAALFSVSETIRLWLSDRPRAERLKGPFRKIHVALTDEVASARSGYALGACVTFVPVTLDDLRHRSDDHRWVLGCVTQALATIAEQSHWRSRAFEAFVQDLMKKEMPLKHVFEQMRKVHRRSDKSCVPWVSFRPGESTVGVRFTSSQGERDEVVYRGRWLVVNTMFGDWGPLVKTAIKGGDFLLMDKIGNVLATLPITEASAPG